MLFTVTPSILFFLLCFPIGFVIYQLFIKKVKEPKLGTTAQLTVCHYVDALQDQSDTLTLKWLRLAGLVIAPFSIISGLLAVLISYVAYFVMSSKARRAEKMPDTWFDQVSADSSEVGKDFISVQLRKHGFVTVAKAQHWLDIEKAQDLAHERATMTGAKAELMNKSK